MEWGVKPPLRLPPKKRTDCTDLCYNTVVLWYHYVYGNHANHGGFMVNDTKKLHLAIGDLADIEVQTSDGETVGNFGDNDYGRALGVAIWNVQHEAWDQAIVTFEQDGIVYEVYVTPHFTEDINGLRVAFQVKLEYTLDTTTQVTEMVSYDEVVKTKVISRLFG